MWPIQQDKQKVWAGRGYCVDAEVYLNTAIITVVASVVPRFLA
jgi:hypothetical protein